MVNIVRIILILAILFVAATGSAQYVNQSLVEQKVQEALRQHRANKSSVGTHVTTQQQDYQQNLGHYRENNAGYVNNVYESNEQIRKNIQQAKEWSAQEMQERHSLKNRQDYSLVRKPNKQPTTTSLNRSATGKSMSSLLASVEGSVQSSNQPSLFYSERELEFKLRQPREITLALANQRQPVNPGILQKAWDYIDMNYTDYLNSENVTVAGIAIRKFYSNTKDVVLEGIETAGELTDSFIEFLNTDWNEKIEEGRISLKEQTIKKSMDWGESSARTMVPSAGKLIDKINVIKIIASTESGVLKGTSIN